MGAIPLRSHAVIALAAMSVFWCGVVAGMLLLHSTNATEPTTPAPVATAAPTKTIRVVPVRSALPVETKDPAPSTTFEDRWSAREPDRGSPSPVADAKAQLASDETKPAQPEKPQDKVCGGRGRNYFYIGHHQYWRCKR
jgi:hypothetical protein